MGDGKQKSYTQWLVIDWRSGDTRTRKTKLKASELGTNEIQAKLKLDIEVPDVDVPALALNVNVPEPRVHQAVLESLDDEDLPDWAQIAIEKIDERYDDVEAAEGDAQAVDDLVNSITTEVLMDAPGRPPASEVREFVAGELLG